MDQDLYFASFDQEKERLLGEFFTLLKFPSMSADPKALNDCVACATHLEKKLTSLGGVVEKWEKPNHPPVLFTTFASSDKNAPTLLLYNHYDVQPVDPLALWETPPFEPTVREGKIFARGAADNKGQLFYTLTALEIFLKKVGSKIPFHLKWVIEGEEESGSASLHQFVKEKAAKLKADAIAVIDVGCHSLKRPALSLGVRGIITMDLVVTGPKGDLHSGEEGGIVLNPLHHLVSILADARDEDGSITIPGFYDAVQELTSEEKILFSFQFDEKEHFERTGVPPAGGERALFGPMERGTIRPTLEINGISGGYGGDGFKTVLPSHALAKISCRLVPDQDPEKMEALLKNHFESLSIPGAKVEVKLHHGGKAVRCSPESPLVKAAADATSRAFGKAPEFLLIGGSIPIAADLTEAAKGDLLFMGVGLPTDAIHAPNENFSLDQLRFGTSLLGNFFETFDKELKK